MYKWQSKFDSFGEKVCTPPTWAPTNLLLVGETSSHISLNKINLVQEQLTHFSTHRMILITYYTGQRMTQFKIRGLAWFKCLETAMFRNITAINAKLENLCLGV